MRLAKAFTKSIHRTLGAALEERAHFLKSLYSEITNGTTARERYLDVGAARAINAKVFGEGFQEVWCLDINFTEQQECESKIQFMVGDAQMLPLKESAVDLLSLFSTIEHLPALSKHSMRQPECFEQMGNSLFKFPTSFFPLICTLAYLIPSGFQSLLGRPT